MEEELISICDRLIDFFQWDLEKETKDALEKGSRRITTDEKLKETVYEAKGNAINYGLGITSLYNAIESKRNSWSTSFADYVYAKGPHDFTPKRIYDLTTYVNLIGEIVELYEQWNNTEFKGAISKLQDHEIFGSKKIEIDPHIVEEIHNLLVKKNQFKLYKYRDGGDEIHTNDSYYLSKKIYFSQDLTAYFRHISTQQEFLSHRGEDEVFITLFGKLDDIHWIYSNWIITLHKGDSIWIMTDQMNFDNPGQKWGRLGRKSVWDTADEKQSLIDLPYYLFEDQTALRGNTTSLVDASTYSSKFVDYITKASENLKIHRRGSRGDMAFRTEVIKLFKDDLEANGFSNCNVSIQYQHATSDDIEDLRAMKGGRLVGYYNAKEKRSIFYHQPEMLCMETKDLHSQSKVFLTILCNKTLEVINILKDDLQPIELMADFMDRKLIEGAKVDPHQTSMRYWEGIHREVFEDTISVINDHFGETEAVALKSYALAISSEHYNASWLTTPEKQQSLTEWMILNKEIQDPLNKIRSLSKEYSRKEATETIISMLNNSRDILREKLFMAETTQIIGAGYRRKPDAAFESESYEEYEHGTIGSFQDTGSVYDKRGIGVFKVGWDEDLCEFCETSNSKTTRIIHIRSYKMLMWLLDCKREDLPIYFRNYRRHDLIPYGGNTLLDQTHPYLELAKSDPCSRSYANGIKIEVYSCGRCKNKLLKDKPLNLIQKI